MQSVIMVLVLSVIPIVIGYVLAKRKIRKSRKAIEVELTLLYILHRELCEIFAGKYLTDTQRTVELQFGLLASRLVSPVTFEGTDISIRESADGRARLASALDSLADSVHREKYSELCSNLRAMSSALSNIKQ